MGKAKCITSWGICWRCGGAGHVRKIVVSGPGLLALIREMRLGHVEPPACIFGRMACMFRTNNRRACQNWEKESYYVERELRKKSNFGWEVVMCVTFKYYRTRPVTFDPAARETGQVVPLWCGGEGGSPYRRVLKVVDLEGQRTWFRPHEVSGK